MDALTILTNARELIAQPGKWTQGFYAYDDAKVPCAANNEGAVCWCSIGAVHKTGSDAPVEYSELAIMFLRKAAPVPPRFENPITHFNDNPDTTQADVVAMFDRAIALCKSSGEARAA